jgi:hypothetical protein
MLEWVSIFVTEQAIATAWQAIVAGKHPNENFLQI